MNPPPGAGRPTATPPAVGRSGVSGHNDTTMTGMTNPVSGRTANRLGAAFYTSVAAVALAGQALAAVHWLHWPLWLATPAVAVLELGGIALAARADYRRRLGERAIWARTLSAAVAVFAVGFNWFGHVDHLAGGFFAGMSALGYAVWLINAGDRRRDQLRAEGKLSAPPPSYEVWRWIRYPMVTARARSLAKADPALGLYPSLAAARDEIDSERRTRAIAKILADRFGEGPAAEIAVHTYRLDEIARRLADTADYDALTALIAEDLTPTRLTGSSGQVPPAVDVEVPPVDAPEPDSGTSAPGAPELPARRSAGSSGRRRSGSSGRNNGRNQTRNAAEPRTRRSAAETRKLALELLAEVPAPTQRAVAGQLGISDRRLRDVLADADDPERAPAPVNGNHPDLIGATA